MNCSSLHTYNLTQCVYDFHEILLSFHHGLDGFVGSRRFVDHVGILAALDSLSGCNVVGHGEAALGFGTRHRSTGSMTTAHEAFGIAASAHDERLGSHAAGNDAQVALACTHRALPSDQHVLAIVVLPG